MPTKDESKSKVERPLVRCPHCDYKCRGTQALGRHKHYAHPDLRQSAEVTVKREFLTGLVATVKDLVAQQRTGPENELESELRSQDAEMRLRLIAVAIAKAQRIVEHQDTLQSLDRLLKARIEELTGDEQELPLETLTALRKIFTDDIRSDVDYLRSILSMREEDDDFVTRLIRVLELSGAKDGRVLIDKKRGISLLEFRDRDEVHAKKVAANMLKSQAQGAEGDNGPKR